MKRIILIAAVMLTCINTQAQNPGHHGRDERGQDRMLSEKISYFTLELDLTPEEAQVFWPVYNQFWKESMEAHKAVRNSLKALKDAEQESISDQEMEKRVQTYITDLEAEQKIAGKYFPKFKSVLPVQKVAKLYVTEEKFKMKMIDNLKQGGGKPKGGHGPEPERH